MYKFLMTHVYDLTPTQLANTSIILPVYNNTSIILYISYQFTVYLFPISMLPGMKIGTLAQTKMTHSFNFLQQYSICHEFD